MINWMKGNVYANGIYATAATTYATPQTVPDSLRNFLGRLRLLYGVPFNYLVPDSRLLPVESIRFLYIDRNFTDRLVEGALSVGKSTTREFVHAQATTTEMRTQLDGEEGVLRRQLRGELTTLLTSRPADLTGLLLRSRAVSGWPGLEIKAYANTTKQTPDDAGTRLPLLRMDRLAPDVMLCIFEGVPTRVDIEEPREGIQFGVDLKDNNGDGVVEPDANVPSGFLLKIRRLRGAATGTQFGPANAPVQIPVPVRASNRRVIHAAALRDALAVKLKATGDPDGDPGAALGAGEFALELFQFPFRQRFEDKGDPAGSGGPTWDSGSQYAKALLKVSVMAKPLTKPELQVLFPAANLG